MLVSMLIPLWMKASGIIVCSAVTLHFTGHLFGITKIVVYVAAICIGCAFGCRSTLVTGRKYPLRLKEYQTNPLLQQMLKEFLTESVKPKEHRKQIIVTRNIDQLLNQIIDYALRDYVSSWYAKLVADERAVTKLLKEEIWVVIASFRERVRKIDDVKFFTSDVVARVQRHLQKFKDATSSGTRQPFELNPFLKDEDSEKEFLRKVTEFLLTILLPPKYVHCQPFRLLLREVFACSVLYPAVFIICDPDYLNRKLIAYLQWQQMEHERHARTYTYARTYEGFVNIINACTEKESLKRIRYSIITEIVDATTINDLKRAKGMDVDKEFNPQTTAKGDLLQARNLKRYINQLKVAKLLCEKRMRQLGGPSYGSSFGEGKEGRLLTFSEIIGSDHARSFFSRYLSGKEKRSLLSFWEAVDEMRKAKKTAQQVKGSEIVQTYINNPGSGIKLNKQILKGIEAFIVADKGPEAFFQAQEEIAKILEERFYHSFVVSSCYQQMLTDARKSNVSFDFGASVDMDGDDDSTEEQCDRVSSVSISIHALTVMQQLEEKIRDKKRAFNANRSRDAKVDLILEKEIAELVKSKENLEDYIEKSNQWVNSFSGCQSVVVVDAEVREQDSKFIDVKLLLCPEGVEADGWEIVRSIADFHTLHQRLLPAASWLKKIELPGPGKPRFRSVDDTYLARVKEQFQKYLTLIVKDEMLSQSEALYEFLFPPPEALKNAPNAKKVPKFSLMQFFRSSQPGTQGDSNDDDVLQFLDEIDGKEDKKDSIAEPLYALIGEVFELKGVFSLLRRTLIVFVQMSYGKTINKQLRETVAWLSSEPMLIWYLETFRDTLWPKGKLMPPARCRSDMEKLRTRDAAKHHLLSNLPEVLGTLVGHQDSRKGMAKVFEALQNSKLNKQLFYDIFEVFICEFAPELHPTSS